jgi:ribosomal protein S27AE
MRLDVDLPDAAEVNETREYLVVDGQRFKKSEFRCPDCHSTDVTADYYDQRRVEGVDAIALGTICESCGSDQLHVGY